MLKDHVIHNLHSVRICVECVFCFRSVLVFLFDFLSELLLCILFNDLSITITQNVTDIWQMLQVTFRFYFFLAELC